MTPAVEVFTFQASKAYQKDPSVLNPVLDIVADWKGSLGIYHGLQVEDRTTGYLFIVWETVQDHVDLTNDPIYVPLKAAISKCVASPPPPLYHVLFEPAPSLAAVFDGPYTALADIGKLLDGKTEDDLNAVMGLVATAKDVKGVNGTAFGEKIEHPGLYAFLTAWDSPEVHAEAKSHPDVANFMSKLMETVTGIESAHVQLKSYKKRYQ